MAHVFWWILKAHFERGFLLSPCFSQGIERFCESMSARQQEILSRLEEGMLKRRDPRDPLVGIKLFLVYYTWEDEFEQETQFAVSRNY